MSDIDWGALTDEVSNEAPQDSEGSSANEEPVAEVESKEPDAPESQEPAPAPEVPHPAQEQTTQEPAPSQATVQQPEQVAPQAEADPQAEREARLAQLAAFYQLTEEQAQAMQLNPEQVLPNVAASIHDNVYSQVLNDVVQLMNQQLPSYVQSMLQQHAVTQANSEKFFQSWEELRAHPAAVQRAVQIFREQYPQATLEQIITHAGPLAWQLAGLDQNALFQKMARVQGQQPQPQPQPQVQGYAPANPGGNAPGGSSEAPTLGVDMFGKAEDVDWAALTANFEGL